MNLFVIQISAVTDCIKEEWTSEILKPESVQECSKSWKYFLHWPLHLYTIARNCRQDINFSSFWFFILIADMFLHTFTYKLPFISNCLCLLATQLLQGELYGMGFHLEKPCLFKERAMEELGSGFKFSYKNNSLCWCGAQRLGLLHLMLYLPFTGYSLHAMILFRLSHIPVLCHVNYHSPTAFGNYDRVMIVCIPIGLPSFLPQ